MEGIIGLIISSVTLGSTVLMYLNTNGRHTNERLTKLEAKTNTLNDIPQRLTRVETVAEYSHTRITELEDDLKAVLSEIKELQIEILRNTKV